MEAPEVAKVGAVGLGEPVEVHGIRVAGRGGLAFQQAAGEHEQVAKAPDPFVR